MDYKPNSDFNDKLKRSCNALAEALLQQGTGTTRKPEDHGDSSMKDFLQAFTINLFEPQATDNPMSDSVIDVLSKAGLLRPESKGTPAEGLLQMFFAQSQAPKSEKPVVQNSNNVPSTATPEEFYESAEQSEGYVHIGSSRVVVPPKTQSETTKPRVIPPPKPQTATVKKSRKVTVKPTPPVEILTSEQYGAVASIFQILGISELAPRFLSLLELRGKKVENLSSMNINHVLGFLYPELSALMVSKLAKAIEALL